MYIDNNGYRYATQSDSNDRQFVEGCTPDSELTTDFIDGVVVWHLMTNENIASRDTEYFQSIKNKTRRECNRLMAEITQTLAPDHNRVMYAAKYDHATLFLQNGTSSELLTQEATIRSITENELAEMIVVKYDVANSTIQTAELCRQHINLIITNTPDVPTLEADSAPFLAEMKAISETVNAL